VVADGAESRLGDGAFRFRLDLEDDEDDGAHDDADEADAALEGDDDWKVNDFDW
jgi:hypothetical protein